nr:hypothetical protein [Nocardioides sp.]
MRAGVEAAGAAEVEDFGGAAEDGGQGLGLAGEAACLSCGDGVAGLEGRDAGGLEVGGEVVEAQVDGDGGGGAAVGWGWGPSRRRDR